MSDFIFSRKPLAKGSLAKEIQAIYHQDKPVVHEFHGNWGSLAVSQSIYNGFQPYENETHIFLVISGPVLTFQDNTFLIGEDGVAGASAVYQRWLSGKIAWDEDLSGPFAVFIVDKYTKTITCVTDLMAFIPIYNYRDKDNIMLSTHVDVLAQVANQQDQIDLVSQVDFILHGVVTYPYTCYTTLKQIAPAAVHSTIYNSTDLNHSAYWSPDEKLSYDSIDQAAEDLRMGLQNYVSAVAKGMPHIAQFISGGEDSRALSGLLPKESKRDAYIFLDGMNREGELAKKAAKAYGANFNLATRGPAHYIEILPACTDLVGSSSQYQHVHTYRFHKSCNLDKYPAVFGGLYADSLLKGYCIKKAARYPFLEQVKDEGYNPVKPIENKHFAASALDELSKRRQAHYDFVKEYRKESAQEWFELWPSSMNKLLPNFHGNRRLFRSYEPFMGKDVVKLSAVVPQEWKLNRRLFNAAVRPFLEKSKWLFHSEGHLPYFPWHINRFVSFPSWMLRKLRERAVMYGLHDARQQGPWALWNTVFKSKQWSNAISQYSTDTELIEEVFKDKDIKKLLVNGDLADSQKVSLMQILYFNHKLRSKL